jgi:tetratricopeptide (TPR) repeat protein/CHAT domain-containing protein
MCVFRRAVTTFLLVLAILWAPGAVIAQTDENIEDIQALNSKADELYRAGKPGEAVGFAEQALALAEQRLGPDNARVGIILRNVGLLYTALSRQAEAEPLALRSLAVLEKAKGADDPEVAPTLELLAHLRIVQKRTDEAITLHMRALAIREKALGPDNPGLIKTLDTLATVHAVARRSPQAESFVKRIIAIVEKDRGPDHPDLGPWLEKLARYYEAQGKDGEVETTHQRMLAIVEKARGPDHRDVIEPLTKLAAFYTTYRQAQYARAEHLYRRCLAITEAAHGPDSIELRRWHDEIGRLFERQNRYADAEAQYQRSLALVEKAKGAEHPDVVDALGKLARVSTALGSKQDAKAVPFYLRMIAIIEKTHGPDHKDLIAPLHSLGQVYEVSQKAPEAEAVYQRALAVADKTLGPEHPDLLRAIDKLASFYSGYPRQEFAKAELLYKRALAIQEKLKGPEDRSVSEALQKLASLYQRWRRYPEAEAIYQRLLAAREKERGPGDVTLRIYLENLAEIAQAQRQYAKAEQIYQRTLAMQEQANGPDSVYAAIALGKLIKLYEEQSNYAKAEPLMRRVLARAEKRYDANKTDVLTHADLHNALNDLGKLLQQTGRLAEAETLFRRALAINEERYGPIEASVFTDLLNLAGVLHDTNRLAEAEALMRRARSIAEGYGPGHEVARALNSLGVLLRDTGQHAEAEALFRRALALAEQFGHAPHIATILGNLAVLLTNTNRVDDAEPLLRRALALNEQHFGPDDPATATPMSNLASLLIDAKRYAEAEPLARRSLTIIENTFGPDHPRVAIRLNNLGSLLNSTGRYAEAEPLLRRAIAIEETVYGPEHPTLGAALNNLGEALMRTGRLPESEEAMRRAIALHEKIYGSTHRSLIVDLTNYATLRAINGDWSGAVAQLSRARPILTRNPSATSANDRTDLAMAMLRQNADSLRAHARALYRLGPQDAALRDESFEIAQWALQTQAAEALSQMSARFGASGGPMVNLVRERQNLLARRQAQDRRLLASVGGADLAASEALRASIIELDNSLDRMDAELAVKFPEFAELTNPKPIRIAALQGLLSPHEAMVLFLDIPTVGILPGETLVWVVTRQDAAWRSVSLDTKALSDSVMALRCGLDRTLWLDKTGAETCRTMLDQPSRRQPRDLPFDTARAHDLFKALLGPDDALIRDKRLLIVPAGPLASLPFSTLVTEAPIAGAPVDYSRTAWLGTRQPLSVLPSVASLKALRQLARASRATKAYLGIGNPLLEGAQQDPLYGEVNRLRAQAARDRQKCLAPRPTRVALETGRALGGFQELFHGKNADIEQIRLATPLPETADEICDVGQRLGVAESEILLGSRASEAALKDMSEGGKLSDYRFLHFATHGAIAGEVRNAAEPGLILTPPAKGTTDLATLERDDGYLTASEIASLRLDPDWVILSACNTASGANAKAEALSGLARAFFYAGARSLLVSHWEVDSEATVKLVTGAFDALARDPRLTHADVLQRSMLALVKAGGQDAHPAYWAPFIVVGADGAALDATAAVEAPDLNPPLPARSSAMKVDAGKVKLVIPLPQKKAAGPASKRAASEWEDEVFDNR